MAKHDGDQWVVALLFDEAQALRNQVHLLHRAADELRCTALKSAITKAEEDLRNLTTELAAMKEGGAQWSALTGRAN